MILDIEEWFSFNTEDISTISSVINYKGRDPVHYPFSEGHFAYYFEIGRKQGLSSLSFGICNFNYNPIACPCRLDIQKEAIESEVVEKLTKLREKILENWAISVADKPIKLAL